jgi:hypothetical protein
LRNFTEGNITDQGGKEVSTPFRLSRKGMFERWARDWRREQIYAMTWNADEPETAFQRFGRKAGGRESREDSPPRVDHLDVVGRLTPSKNGNQEFTTLPDLNMLKGAQSTISGSSYSLSQTSLTQVMILSIYSFFRLRFSPLAFPNFPLLHF